MAIGLPTEEFTLGNFLSDRIDMSNSEEVNGAIELIAGMMAEANWSLDVPQYATLKLTIDLPVVGSAGPFSLIVYYWYGFAYQIWNPFHGDSDPTGTPLLGVGPNGETGFVVGVPVNDGMGQNEIIQEMATMMAGVGDFRTELTDFIDDPGGGLDGVARSILFTAKEKGPFFNDITGNGNIFGGSKFEGVSKFGGYRLRSELSPSSYLDVTLLNNEQSQLLIKTQFGGGPYAFLRKAILTDVVMHKIKKYTVIAGPLQLIITPTRYPTIYNPDNIIDVLQGTFDYWICAPKVPDEQIFKPGNVVVRDRGITASAFRVLANRDILNFPNAATGVCDLFHDGGFGLTDVGVVLVTFNTFENLTGQLLTPTEMPILYSALVSLSDGQTYVDRVDMLPYTTKEALICGYIWDGHFTTRAEVLGTYAYFGSKQYYAYRVQHAPCEATLWIFTGVIK